MADGPRCKRRKQANPKRSSVTNFNTGPEASSDSDDEDKLHIVEEESQEEKSHKKNKKKPVSKHNGDCKGVKDDGGSDGGEELEDIEEEEEEALVEMLQQEDTAVIYPEAPEENGAAETGGADENGTPDTPQLHICPYCSRGYKRNASLKDHIKFRHETSDDNYSCSHCSYTFTYRSQLERHMAHHRNKERPQGKVRAKPRGHSQSSGGSATRKFKCHVCSKAFKYKHHLKEHLRIHSGEKPYECANCKKRFSHSGSYSSHITSKKCAAAHFPNGLHHPPLKPSEVVSAQMAVGRKDGKTDSKPLQEQIPVTQIKTEPMEEDIKPTINGVNKTVAMMVPTVGLMSPIGINISGFQNVFGKVLSTGTQGKQGFMVQQPQQQIISLPAFVDHDGTTKIIINYSLSPAAATTANSQPGAKNSPTTASAVPIVAAAPIPSRTEQQSCAGETQDFPTDLSIAKVVKEEPECVSISDDLGIVISKTESVAEMPKASECPLCEECPEHLEAVHLLQHRKATNGEAVDSAALDPSFADLLSEAGVTLNEPNPVDVLSVLKNAYASDVHPSESELGKLSSSVSVSTDVVRKWFAKMNRKAGKEKSEVLAESKVKEEDVSMQEETQEVIHDNPDLPVDLKKYANKKIIIIKTRLEGKPKASSPEKPEKSLEKTTSQANLELHNYSKPSETAEKKENSEPQSTSSTPDSAVKVEVKTEPEDPDAPEVIPLDLSLPKPPTPEPCKTPEQTATLTPEKATPPTILTVQPNMLPSNNTNVLGSLTRLETTPLNLACINKDQLEPRALYVTTPSQSGNSNFVTATQIPTLVAIAGQGTVGCLSAINPTTKQRTILIPQLTYTYTPPSNRGFVLNGLKKDRQKNLLPAGNEKSKAKMDQGVYPCDICCKVFQKGSSLLRHKYEHTGKRPHECHVCKKAFKHKHHLIEHARLHTGVKPYQCDKCGKRFSHSGSYSQHMNHRYSYCKRNTFTSNSSSASSPTTTTTDTTATATITEEQTDEAASSPVREETQLQSGEEEEQVEYEEEEQVEYEEEEQVEYEEQEEQEYEEQEYEEYEQPEEQEEYEEYEEYEEQEEQEYEEHEEQIEYEEEEQCEEQEEEQIEYLEEEELEYEEGDYEEEAMCVEDIRVVQIDDDKDGRQYEEEEEEESGEEMEVELGEGSDSENENAMDFREGPGRTSLRAK